MTLVELEYPKIERIEGDERYAKFACEPLPPGYGTTLGNSLRRVLLSSLPGAAITAARVRGVAHEFSTIPGVKEDVVQLVLNLKGIRLRSFARLELTVETGRGFHSADRREGLPIGVIPIDALYSPVKKVNFGVESTRVGQVTNYDRLILEVWTDGTTTPDDAVAQGSQILVQQFSLFAGLTRSQTALAQPERTNGSALPAAIADMPIEDLDLPQRAFNSLKRHGITKVGQLLQTPDDELLRMRNFGKKSLDEIKERLAARGLIEAPVRDESSIGSDDVIAEDETETETDAAENLGGDDGEERIG